jgi:hypothetical protein
VRRCVRSVGEVLGERWVRDRGGGGIWQQGAPVPGECLGRVGAGREGGEGESAQCGGAAGAEKRTAVDHGSSFHGMVGSR